MFKAANKSVNYSIFELRKKFWSNGLIMPGWIKFLAKVFIWMSFMASYVIVLPIYIIIGIYLGFKGRA